MCLSLARCTSWDKHWSYAMDYLETFLLFILEPNGKNFKSAGKKFGQNMGYSHKSTWVLKKAKTWANLEAWSLIILGAKKRQKIWQS